MDEIKSKIDIVEVISSYVPLKKAGRNLSGLCPFHGERTPSFMVSPERQAFKCFGCSKGGDVFTFLEEIEGWDFRETLEELAKRSGVKLADFKPTGASRDREKLIAINKLASKFYKYILQKHKLGEPGRQYLQKRGIDEDLWEKFDLGYAPGGWENVSKFLTKKGYQLSDIATAGLIISRDSRPSGGFYDRFRERLMFPIKDSKGVVVGFSGRVLSQNVKEAKYVNSPQTPIFNKGSLLFGLDLARRDIREKGEAVLVEGEFDVLSSHKAGLFNVVASKGTALTDLQIATLSRICERVILCFDTDLAGDAAARRGIELMDIAGLSVKVVEMGAYKDPDEFAQKDAAGFLAAIAKAVDIYDYFLESASKRFDVSSADGKKKVGAEIIPLISKISDDMVRAHYISKLAKLLDLEISLVSEAVSKKKPNIFVAVSQEETQPVILGHKLTQEEYFLALLVFFDNIFEEIITILEPADFENKQASMFWKWTRDIIKSSDTPKSRKFSSHLKDLPKNLSDFVDSLYLVNIGSEFSERDLWAQEAIKTAKLLKRVSLKRKLKGLSEMIRQSQRQKDEKSLQKLLLEFEKKSQEVKNI